MNPEVLKINIKRMRRNNPCSTLVQIGDKYGVTRERVRQILKEAMLPTRAVGNLCYNISNQHFCLNCGKVRVHGKAKFCSLECRKEYTTIQIACTQCGLLIQLFQSSIMVRINKFKNLFCSHRCSALYYHIQRGHKVESDIEL